MSTSISTSYLSATEVLKRENNSNFFSVQRKILQFIKDDFGEDIHLTYRVQIKLKVASFPYTCVAIHFALRPSLML